MATLAEQVRAADELVRQAAQKRAVAWDAYVAARNEQVRLAELAGRLRRQAEAAETVPTVEMPVLGTSG